MVAHRPECRLDRRPGHLAQHEATFREGKKMIQKNIKGIVSKARVKLKDLEVLIDQTPDGIWLIVAREGDDPEVLGNEIGTVKLDYYDGKLRVLVWQELSTDEPDGLIPLPFIRNKQ
jgi:hypothetical protein